MKKLTRREFLKLAGASTLGALLYGTGCAPKATESVAVPPAPTGLPGNPPTNPAASDTPASTNTPESPPAAGQAYLAVGRGADPALITRAAIAALGGMGRFVKAGQEVVIKPNICVDYHPPEYAATTNPFVVAALVGLCLEAGAKRVSVMDNPFGGPPESAYANSGIAEAVKAAGGEMVVMSPVKYGQYDIPQGRDIKAWEFYRDVMEAGVVINVPIAKHHSLAGLTLGGKNMLGVITRPNQIHRNLGQRIADLVSAVRPELTVVDAVRILRDHGPTGGSLDDVQQTNTVIASHDIVSADAYAATLFGMTGADIAYVKAAAEMGLGSLDLSSIKIEEINL